MAEDIDFKYPVKRACTAEITKFCPGVPHGHAAVIRCLQDNLDNEDMSGECREEVTRDQIRSSQDYRLAQHSTPLMQLLCQPFSPGIWHAILPAWLVCPTVMAAAQARVLLGALHCAAQLCNGGNSPAE